MIHTQWLTVFTWLLEINRSIGRPEFSAWMIDSSLIDLMFGGFSIFHVYYDIWICDAINFRTPHLCHLFLQSHFRISHYPVAFGRDKSDIHSVRWCFWCLAILLFACAHFRIQKLNALSFSCWTYTHTVGNGYMTLSAIYGTVMCGLAFISKQFTIRSYIFI